MRVTARRLACSAALSLLLVLALGCSPEPSADADYGKVLPADTMAWVHLEDLPALEDALERLGLMDLLVAELDKPENREELQAKLGLTLAEDPRVTMHEILQKLRRADIAAHPPLHAGAEEPVVTVHLECADDAAATEMLDLVREHSAGEVAVGEWMALRIDAEDELSFVVGRHGAHLLLASEAERWGETMGAIIDPPATGLVDTAPYQRVALPEAAPIMAFITPEAQTELRGLQTPAPGIDPVTMGALMEKYGSQYACLGLDYLLSRLVSRQAMSADSPLEPLMQCESGESVLMKWLPAGTFLYEGWLVENGPQKLALIRDLLADVMGTMSENTPPGQLPPGAEDPIAALEGALGFSLDELAERVREVAVAGTEEAGWFLLMRAHDEVQAQEVAELFGSSPLLGMIPEGPPVEVGGTTLRSFSWPADEQGRLQLLGRHDDTMLLAIQVPDAAAITDFLGQAGQAALPAAAPAHAADQLELAAAGWGYLDMAGLLDAVGQDPDEVFADLPPALAERLRKLRVAGHLEMLGDGVSQTVVEMGQL